MSLRQRLLQTLSDGEFHSGEALGIALGVSRMAVWKHVKVLRELGVELEVVRGKGYRLPASIELLDAAAISASVSPPVAALLGPLHIFHELDSTNNWLREQSHAGAPSGSVCLAEMQSAGRGRRGRCWVSPFAANLYLSLLWRSHAGVAALGGLSLVTGIAVLRCLRAQGLEMLGLKWPNDILAGDAKLAGVLIDVIGESSGPCAVILGVGINVCMPMHAAERIEQGWTDLQHLCSGKEMPLRNRLATSLLDHLFPAIAVFEASGLQPFLQEWRRFDVLAGREVDLHLPDGTVRGTASGIDESGALLVDTPQGRQRFTSCDVSVRFAA